MALILSLLSSPCSRVERELERGEKELMEGELDRAMESFLSILEKEPENVKALYFTGWIYHLMGDNEKARGLFERCIQIDPVYYGGYKGLGSVLLSGGNLPAAEKYLRKALELSEDKGPIYLSLGHLYWMDGRIDLAEKSYREAVDSDPDTADFTYSLAYFFFETGDYRKARDLIESALKGRFREVKFRPLALILKGKILLHLAVKEKEKEKEGVEGDKGMEKRKRILEILKEADRYFDQALGHGNMLRDLKEIHRLKGLVRRNREEIEEETGLSGNAK